MLGAPHFRSSAEDAALESASPATRLAVRGLGPLLHRYEEEQTQSRQQKPSSNRRVVGRGRRRRRKKKRRKKSTAAPAKNGGESTDFIDDAEIRSVQVCLALLASQFTFSPITFFYLLNVTFHTTRKIYQRISHSSNRLASGRSPKHMEWRPDLPAKERRQIQVQLYMRRFIQHPAKPRMTKFWVPGYLGQKHKFRHSRFCRVLNKAPHFNTLSEVQD